MFSSSIGDAIISLPNDEASSRKYYYSKPSSSKEPKEPVFIYFSSHTDPLRLEVPNWLSFLEVDGEQITKKDIFPTSPEESNEPINKSIPPVLKENKQSSTRQTEAIFMETGPLTLLKNLPASSIVCPSTSLDIPSATEKSPITLDTIAAKENISSNKTILPKSNSTLFRNLFTPLDNSFKPVEDYFTLHIRVKDIMIPKCIGPYPPSDNVSNPKYKNTYNYTSQTTFIRKSKN